MAKNKHKPQSRITYEENYPVWSVRMPKEWIDELELELEANGQSRRDFLGVALKKQTLNAEEIRVTWSKKGYIQGYERGNGDGDKKGYNRGVNDWAIWVYCYNCMKPVFIKPNSEDHKITIEQMKAMLNEL